MTPILIYGRQPKYLFQMEDDLKKIMQQKQLKVRTMVVAPLRVTKLIYIKGKGWSKNIFHRKLA